MHEEGVEVEQFGVAEEKEVFAKKGLRVGCGDFDVECEFSGLDILNIKIETAASKFGGRILRGNIASIDGEKLSGVGFRIVKGVAGVASVVRLLVGLLSHLFHIIDHLGDPLNVLSLLGVIHSEGDCWFSDDFVNHVFKDSLMDHVAEGRDGGIGVGGVSDEHLLRRN